MQLFTQADRLRMAKRISAELEKQIPVEINRELVSTWAERSRVLPRGLTPYPGPFSFDMIPYMREIADCMSESSPVREVAVLKGTQIAATVGLGENWIGYAIESSPAPMGYITGDASMAVAQMELRIDAMVNSSGLSDLIRSQHKRRSQRKTGDTAARKEFPGGFLLAMGPNSGSKLRSMSLKYIYVDELDGFRSTTVGKEGDILGLIRRRADAYTETYKILWTSTPTIDQTSLIKRLWEEGDQRRYFVPCKHCGQMQYIKWENLKFEHDDEHRLDCEIDKDGRIVRSSVRYICESCSGEWHNADKDYFLPLGEWRPTAVPRRPGMRSYHVPGLLSPVGFRSWESGVMDFLDIIRKGKPPDQFQNWVNTFLGETFVAESERPKIEAILSRERGYESFTLPADAKPQFITMGADVQKDRIECEVVAWGRNKESWSICYQVLYGDTSDVDGEPWQRLRDLINMQWPGPEPGKQSIALAGIDSGYRTDVVYEFCANMFREAGGMLMAVPVMGSDALRQNRQYIHFYDVDGIADLWRIDINTNILKQEVYRYLNREKLDAETQREGYCHFPADYTRKYFSMLTAEDMTVKNGKIIWDAASRRNEALDCRVYALACLYAIKENYEQLNNSEPIGWGDFWERVDNER